MNTQVYSVFKSILDQSSVSMLVDAAAMAVAEPGVSSSRPVVHPEPPSKKRGVSHNAAGGGGGDGNGRADAEGDTFVKL